MEPHASMNVIKGLGPKSTQSKVSGVKLALMNASVVMETTYVLFARTITLYILLSGRAYSAI